MHSTLLALNLLGATPEIKFFLVAYIREFGSDTQVNLTVKELSQKLGVTSHVVTRATKFLLKRGFFSLVKQSSGTGRPRACYSCTSMLRQELKESNAIQKICHSELIDLVLFNRDKYKNDRSLLSTSNKLLLLVLLMFADKTGVVRNLKRANLQKLTGMSRDRLKSQFRKLLNSEYIRFYVPEMNSPLLFGTSAEVFFLNLPKFKPKSNSSGIVLNAEALSARAVINKFSQKVKRYQQLKANPSKERNAQGIKMLCTELEIELNISVEEIHYLMTLFVGEFTVAFTNYLVLKVNEYASYILSEHRYSLSGSASNYDDLISKIQTEVTPNAFLNNPSNHSNFAVEWNAVTEFIYFISLRLAKDVYQLQKIISSVEFDTMSHVILPDTQHYGTLAVELHSKEGSSMPQEWFFSTGDPIQEKGMSPSQKYLYGLLTQPRKRAVKG